MMRVSPPELARACPGPHASTSVTCAPLRRSINAVQPPKAPAPTTTTCNFTISQFQNFTTTANLRGIPEGGAILKSCNSAILQFLVHAPLARQLFGEFTHHRLR